YRDLRFDRARVESAVRTPELLARTFLSTTRLINDRAVARRRRRNCHSGSESTVGTREIGRARLFEHHNSRIRRAVIFEHHNSGKRRRKNF
ncbi:MAG: hypothetical protein ACYC60_22020, partial [Thermoanaerobaculia bacterium]